MTRDDEQRRPPAWNAHLGLAVSVVALLMIVGKVTAVAHGDMRTVAAILATQSVGDLAIPALTIGAPSAVAAFLFAATISLGEAVREKDTVGAPLFLFVLALLLSLVFVPAPLFGGMLGVGATYILIGLVFHPFDRWRAAAGKKYTTPRREPFRERVGPIGLVALLVSGIALFNDRPWLPTEEVLVAPRAKPVVGYVLAADDRTVAILTHGDRQVALFNASDVTYRTICRTSEQQDDRSVLFRLWRVRPAGYPRCVGDSEV